jgi:hypothetical protein
MHVAQVPLLQGRKRTWYAGAYTLFNTHEIATMSGMCINVHICEEAFAGPDIADFICRIGRC